MKTPILTTEMGNGLIKGGSMEDAINEACEYLPEGYTVSLKMEAGAAWVELEDPKWKQIELPCSADMDLKTQLKEAVNKAIIDNMERGLDETS